MEQFEWHEFYSDRVPSYKESNWETISREVNSHRTSTHIPVCDYCTKEISSIGKLPGETAPNFWHKTSGFRVWWYKWVGRDMKIFNPDNEKIESIKNDCLLSISK